MQNTYTPNNSNAAVAVSQSLNEIWLDNFDVLTLLHISKPTLQKWRRMGTISFSRIGGKRYYKKSEIIALLHRNNRKNRS